jgi:hypothetical protein
MKKTSGGIGKDATGIYQTFQIDQLDYDTLEKTSTANDPNKLSVKLHSSSSGLEASSGLKINLYPFTSGLEITSTGLRINTGLNSGLTLAADGISINPTYKTELTTLKTQAQTAATVSETSKDAAIIARNAAQSSQSAAGTSATAASTSATTAATEATAAAASVTVTGLAAGAAVLLGLSGKADSTHYHSQYLETTTFNTEVDKRWKISGDIVYFDAFNANRLVGIGKPDPSSLLDVNGTINATGFT